MSFENNSPRRFFDSSAEGIAFDPVLSTAPPVSLNIFPEFLKINHASAMRRKNENTAAPFPGLRLAGTAKFSGLVGSGPKGSNSCGC